MLKINPVDAIFSAWHNASIRNPNPKGAKAVKREFDDVESLNMIWDIKPKYLPVFKLRKKAVA